MPRKMIKRAGRLMSFAGAVGLTVLVTPQPAGATELGGYELSAVADAIHIQMYEPSLPLPGEPQGDMGIGHTRSTGSFGPSTRGTSSAVWPGDVLGDGFGVFAQQFGGDPNTKYPVQINSFYPNKPNSAKQDFGGGNGEFSTATDKTTSSQVQLVGLSNSADASSGTSGTGGLSGLIPGLPKPGTTPSATSAPAASPVPVGSGLAALVESGAIASSSVITYAGGTVTSTSHAKLGDVSLLGGVIKLKSVDVTAVATSDGTKGTSSGTATVSGVTVAGQDIGISTKGATLGPAGFPVPDFKTPVNTLLKATGISIDVLPGSRTVTGAVATATETGLVLTIDTTVVKNALGDPGSKLAQLLSPILDKIPQNDKYSKMFVSSLYGVLNLGPKLVINVGDVSAKASASPAFVFTPPAFSGNGVTLDPNPGQATSPATVGGGLGNIGGTLPEVQADTTGGDAAPLTGGTNPGNAIKPVAKALPPLGKIPPMLIVGSLALAAAIGWLFQMYGGPFITGAARVGAAFCSMGLDTDLPNLREGQ